LTRYKFMAVAAGLALAVGIVNAGSANAVIGTGTVTNRYYGLCLDATDNSTSKPSTPGDPVQLWHCFNGAPPQQSWTFNADPGNWGTIKNGSGLCLDARDDGTVNPSHPGDPVQLWSCNGGSQQLWRALDYFGPYYELENGAGTHLVLDARNDAAWNPTRDGDPVQLYTDSGQDNQLFTIP
jgi:hypothetical protein